MKKLLSLLSAITMAGSGIAGIVGNAPTPTQEQQIKLENNNKLNFSETNNSEMLSLNDYLEFNNKFIKKVTEKSNIFITDSKNNIYFGIKNEFFLLKEEEKPIKIIKVSNDIIFLEVDTKNNVYIGTNDELFSLKMRETKANKLMLLNSNKINCIVIGSQDNVYIGTDSGLYILKQGESIPT